MHTHAINSEPYTPKAASSKNSNEPDPAEYVTWLRRRIFTLDMLFIQSESLALDESMDRSHGTTTIIRRVQNDGSAESWEDFVSRYEHVIIEYALSSGLRRDHAEDLRQTVFLELVKLLPTLVIDPQRGSFRSILRTMVKRRSIDFLRRHYRDADFHENYVSPDNETQDTQWEKAWESGLLKQALGEVAQSLNPESYQAFELTTVSRVPAKEVSKLLGISVDSVYQKTSRVKSAIEAHYKRLHEEADTRPESPSGL